jgi:hypothetical protein
MRLTAEGNLGIGTDKPLAKLDVNGLIRTSEGVVFPDGSIQRSAAMPSILRMRPSNPESDKKLHPKSQISGAGTTNQVTKWLDGLGTVGDSTISEVGGKVGIGTTNPGGQLHIYGTPLTDVFAGMGQDVVNGPGFNYGYAGGSFGVGAGFFNVRPAVGATGVNPSLRFMTVDQQRMIITNAGNVGIGTGAPMQTLDVVGSVALSGNLVLPATTATAGVITLGGNRFAHTFGSATNTFLGANAGNFTMSGLGANTAIGNSALTNNTTGAYNTANGLQALYSNTTGNDNVASGVHALYFNTVGSFNTAIGNYVLANNVGSNNTGSGYYALAANTTGNTNTASGYYALYANTTGAYNTASGAQALQNNTSAYFNTASGSFALGSNTTGQENMATGYAALNKNTTGNYNTASGGFALYNNTSGSSNVAVGDSAGYILTTGSNNIDIGNQGVAAEANTIRIGVVGTQTKAFIAGINGVTTGGAAVAVLVDANGQLGTVSSSRRYKFDIASMGDATEGLMRLRPVTFRYLAHGEHAPLQYGLIAEEVAEVYPELVARNKSGEVETVMYQLLAPMLLNEVQRQHGRIEEQQSENKALGQRTADLQTETRALRTENTALRDQLERLMRRVEQLEVKRTASQQSERLFVIDSPERPRAAIYCLPQSGD